MDKFIEKDPSVQDKIAERYNMITMEELDNQFNNNIVTRIFLFPDHLKENSKKDCRRWQKNRPQANTSQQIIDPNSNTLYDQNALASLMKVPPKSLPKWLNDIILGELRPLFLRVRFLDEKNEILDLIN